MIQSDYLQHSTRLLANLIWTTSSISLKSTINNISSLPVIFLGGYCIWTTSRVSFKSDTKQCAKEFSHSGSSTHSSWISSLTTQQQIIQNVGSSSPHNCMDAWMYIVLQMHDNEVMWQWHCLKKGYFSSSLSCCLSVVKSCQKLI